MREKVIGSIVLTDDASKTFSRAHTSAVGDSEKSGTHVGISLIDREPLVRCAKPAKPSMESSPCASMILNVASMYVELTDAW